MHPITRACVPNNANSGPYVTAWLFISATYQFAQLPDLPSLLLASQSPFLGFLSPNPTTLPCCHAAFSVRAS
ncbi:hypothetical protein L596_007865 [Steinernema carpocapsae]|uniref:Uncharacterized protein n=1 Tax=Steinernema carpocapsae TaxID=34508 RepID=A0A4U5PAP0_STECR|nr:hypothetical protein L596_007865 [Steinernema carpocapsae]